VQTGVGVEKWKDGSWFRGNYEEGKKYGFGIYMWRDGASYKGRWEDGKIGGFGTYKWADGRQFTGEWVNCKIGGFGVYTWSDGRRYTGFFARDKRQGFGIYKMPDQSSRDELKQNTYSGSWLNGKQHGYGCIYSATGPYKYGVWKDGNKILKLSKREATDI